MALFQKNKIYITSIKVDKKTVKLSFPKYILEYLNLQENKAYFIPMNGTIQIVGKPEEISIPPLKIKDFARH